jgi:hypothetical protein
MMNFQVHLLLRPAGRWLNNAGHCFPSAVSFRPLCLLRLLHEKIFWLDYAWIPEQKYAAEALIRKSIDRTKLYHKRTSAHQMQ